MPDAALSVSGLTYSFGDVRAVDNLSVEVGAGEIVGLLGPNGAGKSTTIRMLTGQLQPQSGSITILGQPMPAARESIQARMGVCFEEKNVYDAMSAAENLKFFASLFKIKPFDPMPLLERVDLASRANDRVSTYSKGMRQRLMMARSLINEPDILFLDEPTDGLDPVSSRTIRDLIKDQAARGATVMLTTHDMFEADELSDRVAFIHEGSILAIDTPEELKLAHGQRSVKVRTRTDGQISEIVVPLDDPDATEQLRQAMSNGHILTIHTEEATLEDIFIEFAGRGLSA
jgi:ABC-2 type transport system ATP-binding protein